MTQVQQFEAFVRDYQNLVFTTAMRLLANHSEAQDVTQEVFLRAYERFDQLKDSPTVGGWLRTVATNLSLNHLSRYRLRWRFFSELASGRAGEDDGELEFAASDDVGRNVDAADRHALVERELQRLPAAQRVPLVLFHLEDLSYEEIAARLKVSLGKVKTDIFRGRETLRQRLGLVLDKESANP